MMGENTMNVYRPSQQTHPWSNFPAFPSHSLGKAVLPRVQSEPSPYSDYSFTCSLRLLICAFPSRYTERKGERGKKKCIFFHMCDTHCDQDEESGFTDAYTHWLRI